jgi:hypothetical protein
MLIAKVRNWLWERKEKNINACLLAEKHWVEIASANKKAKKVITTLLVLLGPCMLSIGCSHDSPTTVQETATAWDSLQGIWYQNGDIGIEWNIVEDSIHIYLNTVTIKDTIYGEHHSNGRIDWDENSGLPYDLVHDIQFPDTGEAILILDQGGILLYRL